MAPLRREPPALLAACAEAPLAGDAFEAAVGELAAALLMSEAPADPDRLAEPIRAAVASDGRHSDGAPPSRRNVSRAVSAFLLRGEPIGIIGWPDRSLTAAGRDAPRSRALDPARSIL